MAEDPTRKSGADTAFSRAVGLQEARKLKVQRKPGRSVWFGLGLFGLIGWSVVIPTLVGTALGVWMDKHHSGKHSWTLMLLIIGLSLGCLNAWHWVAKENKEIHGEEDEHDE